MQHNKQSKYSIQQELHQHTEPFPKKKALETSKVRNGPRLWQGTHELSVVLKQLLHFSQFPNPAKPRPTFSESLTINVFTAVFLRLLLSLPQIVHLIVFTQGVSYGKAMFAEKPLIKPKVLFAERTLFKSNFAQILTQQMCNHTLESMWDRSTYHPASGTY